MKVIAYDVLVNEMQIIKNLETELGVSIETVTEHLTKDNLNRAKGYDGISVLGYSKITKEILEQLKEMGIYHVSTRTIGYDHIDIEAASHLGIAVSNACYEPNNVAEFTVMIILMLLRKAKISICRALVNDFSLDGMNGRELRNITVGIIGTGKIGSTVIQNLSGFGCRILAFDHYKNKAVEDKAEYVELETIYRESDVISLHIPMTESNYHMINKNTIAMMKDGILLINTARGSLVDTESLIEALENGKVGGAGIDTLEEEDGVMHVHVGTNIVQKRSLMYIKQFPNVVYTQHYAFFTEEACESMVRCGIVALQKGYNKEENPYLIKMNH